MKSMMVHARVQSYITRNYFIGYITLLVLLFLLALAVINVSERAPLTSTRWWFYDIPWICLTVVAWIPVMQIAYYRQTFVTAELDEVDRLCRIEGPLFAGEWSIKKKYPQRMSVTQVAAIVFSVLILVMLLLDIGSLHKVWYVAALRTSVFSKVTAVQTLCLPVMLSSILVRMWTYWKYPNLVVLRQHGKLLSLQFKDKV